MPFAVAEVIAIAHLGFLAIHMHSYLPQLNYMKITFNFLIPSEECNVSKKRQYNNNAGHAHKHYFLN